MQNLINNRRSDLLEEYEQEFESYSRSVKRKHSSSDELEDDDAQEFSNGETPSKFFCDKFQKSYIYKLYDNY